MTVPGPHPYQPIQETPHQKHAHRVFSWFKINTVIIIILASLFTISIVIQMNLSFTKPALPELPLTNTNNPRRGKPQVPTVPVEETAEAQKISVEEKPPEVQPVVSLLRQLEPPFKVKTRPPKFAQPNTPSNMTNVQTHLSSSDLVHLNVSAVIFYGRRQTVSILYSYLERNLIQNGGILHRIYFVCNTNDKVDLAFLDKLIARHPQLFIKVDQIPQIDRWNFRGHYDWMPPNQLFVKIDDDIVFIEDDAIANLVTAKLKNRYLFVSANVVNHPILTPVHHQMGAMDLFEIDRRSRTWSLANPSFKSSDESILDYMNQWHCGWQSWYCAAQVHENFFRNFAQNLDLYKFPTWDFHAYDYSTRWSINMFVMNTSDVIGKIHSKDDEQVIAVELSKSLKRHSGAVGNAIAVHYSYFPQRRGLNTHSDAILQYRSLAKQVCGYVLNEDGELW